MKIDDRRRIDLISARATFNTALIAINSYLVVCLTSALITTYRYIIFGLIRFFMMMRRSSFGICGALLLLKRLAFMKWFPYVASLTWELLRSVCFLWLQRSTTLPLSSGSCAELSLAAQVDRGALSCHRRVREEQATA